MNQVLENIKNRYSCRSFKSEMPTEAELSEILQAAITSPSAMNRQNWRVIAVKSAEGISELENEGMENLKKMPDQSTYERIMSRGGKLFYNAPMIIFIPTIPNDTAAALDCGIVCQTIALAAHSLGLGTCICGLAALAFAGDKAGYFKEKLKFPEGYEFGAAVLVGTPAVVTAPHEVSNDKIIIIE